MIVIVIAFLFLSILFYLVFGGADFGVGVLEFLSNKKNKIITKRTAYKVIGPVWEANHIWLIICIVILWIGFPIYYNLMVTQLHFPLTLLLVGIIGRGTAFVFRHYDAYQDKSQQLYDKIFEWSSVFAPFFIGITAGSLVSGNMIHPNDVANSDFRTLYLDTWLNPFSILMGFFVTSLFAFTSSIFITGDTQDEEHKYYKKKARRANIAAILFGVALFIEAYISDRFFLSLFLAHKFTFAIFILVTGLIVPLWYFIKKENKLLPRLFLGIQLFLILFVWSYLAFPNLILFKSGTLSILDNTPPDVVYNTLGVALLTAAVFVLPGLYHLFKTFGLISK